MPDFFSSLLDLAEVADSSDPPLRQIANLVAYHSRIVSPEKRRERDGGRSRFSHFPQPVFERSEASLAGMLISSIRKPASPSSDRISLSVARWLIEGSRAQGTGKWTSAIALDHVVSHETAPPGFRVRRASA